MSVRWRGQRFSALLLAATVIAATAASAQQDGSQAFTFTRDVAEARLWFAAQDRAGAPVGGLAASQLTVFDGGVRVQRLSRLSQVEDAPVRVHFVVDVSGSDQRSLATIQEALAQFVIGHSRPDDTIAITAFSDHSVSARLRSHEDAANFWNAAARLIGKPVTAIYDNLYPALATRQQYDAVVLISDGDDNWSAQHNLSDILAAAQQSPARVFALGVEVKRHSFAQEVLERIAQAGGGQMMGVRVLADANGALAAIAQSLCTYYTVSFPIAEEQRDGRFHLLTLKISDGRIARIQVKPGYYAPPRNAAQVETASAALTP
jgi:VWFA-related protein